MKVKPDFGHFLCHLTRKQIGPMLHILGLHRAVLKLKF